MYGIDFGTSNTVVTHRTGGITRVLQLDEGGIIPSLLYFERDRRPAVGREAMRDYASALELWRGHGDLYSRFRFFQGIKLALKDPYFEGTALFGSRVKVEALAAIFLKEVKRRADEATGVDSRRLVLGRPVVLSPEPAADARLQKRFAEAALIAGFEEVDFVLEPVAASVDVAGAEGDVVLVFDFGGGTLDISLARWIGGGPEILASVGADLGGYLLNEDLSRARIIGHFGAGKVVVCLTAPGRVFLEEARALLERLELAAYSDDSDQAFRRMSITYSSPCRSPSERSDAGGLVHLLVT